MKKYRKRTSFIILIVILLSMVVASFAAQTNTEYRMKNLLEDLSRVTTKQVNSSWGKFSDMGSHWAKDSVGKLTYLGIIGGYPDGSFKPNQNIQVDEFIKLTVTAMGYKAGMGNGYWAEPFIQIAKDEKLIGANEFSNYRRPITRQEMAKIIVNATMTKEEAIKDDKLIAFLRGKIKDYPRINDHYKHYALNAYGMGLIGGYPDGTFKGTNNSTRAEASVVILRFMQPSIRPKVVGEDEAITLPRVMTGEPITAYASKSNPEVIKVAQILKNNKSKGFYRVSYNDEQECVLSSFFESEETAVLGKTHMAIDIKTKENEIIPYSIVIWNLDRTKELHQDVFKDVFKVIFEGDSQKAWAEYEKYLGLASTSRFSKLLVLNDRHVSFFSDRAGGMAIAITQKGYRFQWGN